jgi:rare lipoprotein A (peptidoglycan hydrolase)
VSTAGTVATTFAILALAGCGSSPSHPSEVATSAPATTTATAAAPGPEQTTAVPHRRAHPQAVEPVAGQAGRATSTADPPPARAPATNAEPSAPATASAGASPGAPSDAEVRAEVQQFKRIVAQYHLDRINFSRDLLSPAELPPGEYHTSIASVETLYGHRDACGTILRADGLGVAHKTLPCGTEVIFVYHGRAIKVPVQDRGPYIPGREWDLSGAAAEALHFPGLGTVQWRLG